MERALLPVTLREGENQSVYSYFVFFGKLNALNISTKYLQHNALPQRPSHRSFSTTKLALSSSPFRLSSKNTPAPDEAHYEREAGEEGEDGYYSPYQPKRQWPPDMSKLSPKHQFRLERKYRRRAALKYARPRWVKATKLVQWGVIACKLL